MSVITVVYNSIDLLKRTVDAVRTLTYPAFEHVVIDGGSTDGTLEFLEGSEDLRWQSERDRGIYDAMNKGMALATGEFIWFLNAGDLPNEPDILDRVMSHHADFDFFYGNTQLIAEDGLDLKLIRAPRELNVQGMQSGMVVSHQSMIVRKSLAPVYDLSYPYIADQKWAVDILRRSNRVRNCDFTLAKYLYGGLSHRKYGHFLADKVRYSFRELPLIRAVTVSLNDSKNAARFYLGALLRRVKP